MNSIPDVAADVHDDPEGEGPRMFLTAREVGHELGVGASRVYALAADGLLPAFRLGRRLYFPRRALEALADAAVETAVRDAGARSHPPAGGHRSP